MLLKELYIGSIDAKNELVESSALEHQRFLYNFVIPPTIQIDDLLNGERYFVTGMKGIGKTSLLRYLGTVIAQDCTTVSQFILFKSDFTEEDKVSFSRSAQKAQVYDANVEGLDGLSFETLWKWFLYKSMINLIDETGVSPFIINDDWGRFKSCVLAPQLGDEKSGIRRILPNLTSGKVSISYAPSLELDFDWDDKEKRTVLFSRLTRQADELFARLKPSRERVVLFFDELELNTTSSDHSRRDAELIRDLILAIEQFNGKCRYRGYNCRVISAIRSEVIYLVESIGKEVNKTIFDFGVPIVWTRGGVTNVDHPILDLIVRRLQYSEKKAGNQQNLDKNAVWSKYFPTQYAGKHAEHFLLNMTWFRPRDLIRLLSIAKNTFPNNSSFDENCIGASRKEYSYQSWIEIAEELSGRYEKREIEAVKAILNGFVRTFEGSFFAQRMTKLSSEHNGVKEIRDRYGYRKVLEDLYFVGILGNYMRHANVAKQYRFHFKGDLMPNYDELFVVHPALCQFFGIF
jgi:energy-coupling factor transporter ATP-binding protein EcfA2